MSAFFRYPSLFAAALVFFLTLTHLDAKSVTVDDAETDKIHYSPSGWKIGNGCPDCEAKPDTSRVNTWRDGSTKNDSIPVFFTFTFTGTSVEVIYLAFTTADIICSIDSVQYKANAQDFKAQGLSTDPYNQTLFKRESLANVQHTLRVDISSRPASLLLDYIIYDDGSVVAPDTSSLASSTVSSTSGSTSPTDNQPVASLSGSSPNIGAIVGGVVAGVVVVVALIWYLRRRSQQASTGGIFPFLRSRSRANANANAPPPSAQTQELPGFHYTPSGISSQVFYSPLPTSGVPQPPPSSQVGTYTPARKPRESGHPSNAPSTTPSGHPWTNSTNAPSTTPSGLSATTKASDTLSDPLGMPPSSAQAPVVAGPPNSSYHAAANVVPGQIPSEPVEEGLMSGRRRARYP